MRALKGMPGLDAKKDKADRQVSEVGSDMTQAFDYEKALKIADGDEELLRELVSLFRGESPRFLADMERAIKAGQAEQLLQAAHTIKGSLGNLGAMAAYESALALEMMGRNGDLEQAEAEYVKLVAEVQMFEQEAGKMMGVSVQ